MDATDHGLSVKGTRCLLFIIPGGIALPNCIYIRFNHVGHSRVAAVSSRFRCNEPKNSANNQGGTVQHGSEYPPENSVTSELSILLVHMIDQRNYTVPLSVEAQTCTQHQKYRSKSRLADQRKHQICRSYTQATPELLIVSFSRCLQLYF